MSDACTFKLGPKRYYRFNAGDYDREKSTPKFCFEISAPAHVKPLVEVKQFLIKTGDGHLWCWDFDNSSDWPILITVKKNGEIVPYMEV